MKEVKEMKIENLENITGGSGLERKEIIDFIKEHYPDVKTSSAKELKSFIESLGISNVEYHPNLPNIYYDKDGNELNHEQFMKILKDSIVK